MQTTAPPHKLLPTAKNTAKRGSAGQLDGSLRSRLRNCLSYWTSNRSLKSTLMLVVYWPSCPPFTGPPHQMRALKTLSRRLAGWLLCGLSGTNQLDPDLKIGNPTHVTRRQIGGTSHNFHQFGTGEPWRIVGQVAQQFRDPLIRLGHSVQDNILAILLQVT